MSLNEFTVADPITRGKEEGDARGTGLCVTHQILKWLWSGDLHLSLVSSIKPWKKKNYQKTTHSGILVTPHFIFIFFYFMWKKKILRKEKKTVVSNTNSTWWVSSRDFRCCSLASTQAHTNTKVTRFARLRYYFFITQDAHTKYNIRLITVYVTTPQQKGVHSKFKPHKGPLLRARLLLSPPPPKKKMSCWAK